jgi:hypothetical protein
MSTARRARCLLSVRITSDPTMNLVFGFVPSSDLFRMRIRGIPAQARARSSIPGHRLSRSGL